VAFQKKMDNLDTSIANISVTKKSLNLKFLFVPTIINNTKMKSMKKALVTLAVAALFSSRLQHQSQKAGLGSRRNSKIDSVTMVMENVKAEIDFTVQEVDKINQRVINP